MLGGALWGEPAFGHVGISEQKASKGFGHLSADPNHSWGGSRPPSTSVPWWQRAPRLTSQLCLTRVSPHAVHFPTHACVTLPSLFHAAADTQLFMWLEMARVSPPPRAPGAWLGQCVPVPVPANNEVLSAWLRVLERAQPRISHVWQA